MVSWLTRYSKRRKDIDIYGFSETFFVLFDELIHENVHPILITKKKKKETSPYLDIF